MMMAVLLACGAITAPDVSLYAPTPVEAVEAMLKLAEVTESDIVYDLGCGDGRVLVFASHLYGCRSVGYDIDPDCVAAANRNINVNSVWDLSRAHEGDILKVDFDDATVVTLYLMEDLLEKLKPKLDEQLTPGTRIVCFEKPIPGVKPTRQVKVSDHTLYLYRTPLVPIKCTGST